MPPHSFYTSVSDANGRREYGPTRGRRTASTGGGRAWSEEEEAYLLRTRPQKMPYKHIAAHLRKTELACRLHYHQLSHGTNRRKGNFSVWPASSTGNSPVMPSSVPSPVHELQHRLNSPPGSSGSCCSVSPAGMQPSKGSSSTTGRHPSPSAILPKPASTSIVGPAVRMNSSADFPCSKPVPKSHSATLPPPTPSSSPYVPQHFPSAPRAGSATPRLRLDCSVARPARHHQVDMRRLHAIYSGHRASFWATIAAEYGDELNPSVLEQAWKSGVAYPITPDASPEGNLMRKASIADKTRISAILGIDADPRSPKEREMVRRIEQQRKTL